MLKKEAAERFVEVIVIEPADVRLICPPLPPLLLVESARALTVRPELPTFNWKVLLVLVIAIDPPFPPLG